MVDITQLLTAMGKPYPATKLQDGREFIVSPDGYGLTDVSVRAVPDRIIARRSFADGDSLAAYVRRFADSSSLLVADIGQPNMGSGPKIAVALDYHPSATNVASSPPPVGAVDHIAVWAMDHSEELKAWAKFEGKLHPQEDFIRFLEENAMDIVSPEPAKLLDLCRDFEAIKTVNFKSSKRLQNGDREFVYSETTGTADRIAVPEKIKLRIPLFYGEQAHDVDLLFRYRMKEGGLSLGYEFHRMKPVLDAAFRSAAVRVAESAGLPAHFGSAF
jgi:hypothetical protein